MRLALRSILSCSAFAVAACARVGSVPAPPPLSTDRPSFSTGTGVVPVGFPQVESGVSISRTDGTDLIAVGEATLRSALTPTLELRVTAPSYLTLRSAALNADGFGDAALGAKLVLREATGEPGATAPALSLLLGSTLPTGAEAFGATRGLLSGALLADWALAPRLGLNANVSWAQATSDAGTADSWAGVLGLSVSHNERLGSFVQVFSVQGVSGTWDAPYLIGGLTILVRPTLQLDVHGGARTSSPGSAHYMGLGISRRF